MKFECSRCHNRITVADGDSHRCGQCGAEAGLEPVSGNQPPPVKAFAAVFSVAIVMTLVSLVLIGVASQ